MGQMRSAGMVSCMLFILALLAIVAVVTCAELPFPAPDIPNLCSDFERCCMPTPYKGKPAYNFQYEDSTKKVIVRRPAHLLTENEIARLEKGYKLMRALPDSDPRSLLNQMKLHCMYCDNALYYPGQQYPLEVHNGWFFLPWHRMFSYWHERILAKLLNDDTFALPYWAWDNSGDTKPVPMEMPAPYARKGSPLYNEVRNNCSFPPFLVDMDTITGCTDKTSDFIRIQNERLLYSQLVVGAPTPSLLFGMPYYFGDVGGKGPGTFEDQPHGTIHAWLGKVDAANLGPPYRRLDDMGNFGRTAIDPIFYPVHTNVDRLWELLKRLPDGNRTNPTHPAFLNSQFTFYDENANLVIMNVSQTLDSDLLRYKYEEYATPWVTNGVQAGRENSIPHCNPMSESATKRLIRNTPKPSAMHVLYSDPITFKLDRPPKSAKGVEVLEISGIHIPDLNLQARWKVFLFNPNVTFRSGAVCPEYAGTMNFVPHTGQAIINPDRVWRVAVGPKLKQLGKDYVTSVVVTMVQTSFPLQAMTIDSAKIIYDMSPEVTI